MVLPSLPAAYSLASEDTDMDMDTENMRLLKKKTQIEKPTQDKPRQMLSLRRESKQDSHPKDNLSSTPVSPFYPQKPATAYSIAIHQSCAAVKNEKACSERNSVHYH